MRINNTQNSPVFGTRYAVVDTKISNIMSTFKMATEVKTAIKQNCERLGIPLQIGNGDMAGYRLKIPFITGQADITAFRTSGMDEIAFVKTEHPIVLNLFEVLKAIREELFDFANGKILTK